MYVLSLTPTDSDHPTVVAHLEIDGGRLRVVELTVRPGGAGTPLPGEIAGLDFRLVAEQAAAMSAGSFSSAPASCPVGGEREPSDQNGRAEPVDSPPTGSARGRGRHVPDGTGAGTKGVPSDLAKLYWQLGSVAKVADHYEVPRQIARGWIKVLRDGRALPDPWSGARRRRT